MKYDVVIVGGGAAGSVLASRLAEYPNTSVLLLEAGPDYPDPANAPDEIKWGNTSYAESPDSEHNWALRGTLTEEQGEMHVAQGKVIGGGSSINGQAMQRGMPEDFDAWAAMGNDEWSYTKVLPFFRKYERDLDIRDDFHGTDGPMPVRRRQTGEWPDIQKAFHSACLDAGYHVVEDTNGANPAGVGVWPSNNVDGLRISAAVSHLAPMRHCLNLTVRGEVFVRKVLFEGKKAVGVEVESGGEVFAAEAEQIVLSSGAIGSPQILLLSGVGPADHLAEIGIPVVANRPGVGQNMRDHPNVTVKFTVKEGLYDDPNGMRALRLRFSATGSKTPNDMILSPASMNTVIKEGDNPSHTINCGLYLAIGKGELRLTSADPRKQPRMDYHYLEDTWDRERLREAVRKCVDLLKGPAYFGIIEERTAPLDSDLVSDQSLDDWLLRNVSSSFHISGTCKMGPDTDGGAVVDQHLNVRGVEGLRVVDASVMPDVVRANTNVTTMMIAERAADFIREGR